MSQVQLAYRYLSLPCCRCGACTPDSIDNHNIHTGIVRRNNLFLASILRQVFPCVFKPWEVSILFRAECQRTAAEMAGVAVVRVELCSDLARETLITIKRDKRFGVNRHNIGPLGDDAQG